MSMPHATAATRRLGIDWPIVQGPFGGGLSTLALASAVSNQGGLGSFGAHMLAPDAIGALVADLRAATPKPFAVNLWVSDHDPGGDAPDPALLDRAWALFRPWFEELGVARPQWQAPAHPSFDRQVDALLAARPPVFSFVFGVPSAGVLAECRRLGIVTVGAATSIAEGQALDAAGVDLIVASGAEAGGHRPSFLARAEDSLVGTLTLVQLLRERVRAPLIAAGGLVDGRGIRAALTLGAGAAQLGTAFLACAESAASDGHRAALANAAATPTVLTRAFTGRLARGLRNRWTEAFAQRQHELPPFPVTSWFLSHLKPAAQAAGRHDLTALWSGQIAPNLRHRDVTSLMQALVHDLHADPTTHPQEALP